MRISSLIAVAFLLLFFGACKKKAVAVDELIWDLNAIQASGILKVGILPGSMSYFIYKGEEMGYEYELVKSFSGSVGLKPQFVVASNESQLLDMLEDRRVDIIAYNIPVSMEGKNRFLYCGREVISEQVLVQRNQKDSLVKDVTGLAGKNVWVIHDSKFHKRLINLNDELGGGINIKVIERDTITTEDLIELVSLSEIDYTVSELELAKLSRTYYSNLDANLKISHPQRSSWIVNNDCPALAEAVSQWFNKNENTPSYRARTKRYFELSKMPGDAPAPLVSAGQISPYDDLFKQYGQEIGLDWRLLASIAYQESKFHTDLVSWAGATGLMGLMPRTAKAFGITPEEMEMPEPSVRAASGYIKRLIRIFSQISDDEERIKFILAAYNAGSGHIYDAQALTKKYGKDPYLWDDVKEFLTLKSLPEYYNDPVVKNGYFKSRETINYVTAVVERWHYYQNKIQ